MDDPEFIPELDPQSRPSLRLLIEPLNLGADVRAISLDLAEEGADAPPAGPEALAIWTAAVPALVADEEWTLDFVSHLDRVRDFAAQIIFRGAKPARDASASRIQTLNNSNYFSRDLKPKLSASVCENRKPLEPYPLRKHRKF